jgi:protease I
MRIACVLGPNFEDSEFRVPFDRFRAAGHEVTIIGLEADKVLRGDKGKEQVKTDVSIDDVAPEDFDVLFIPGGFSPDNLRGDPRMVKFVRSFKNEPILAICHGPQLLITADLVRGRKMTASKTVQVDLKNAGANVVDQEVIVDGKLVTSRQPQDLDAFVRESLRMLEEVGEQPTA